MILIAVIAMLMDELIRTIIRGKKDTKKKRILSVKKFLICLFIIYLYNIFNFANTKLI